MNNSGETFDPIMEEARKMDAQMMGAGPSAEAAVDDVPTVPSAEILKPTLFFFFSKFAPNWKVSEDESDDLARKLGAVVDKWVPGGALKLMDRWKEEGALVVCCIAIYSKRVDVPLTAPAPAKVEGVESGKASQTE